MDSEDSQAWNSILINSQSHTDTSKSYENLSKKLRAGRCAATSGHYGFSLAGYVAVDLPDLERATRFFWVMKAGEAKLGEAENHKFP